MALTKLNFGGNQQALVAANIPTLTANKMPTGSIIKHQKVTWASEFQTQSTSFTDVTSGTLDYTPVSANSILRITSLLHIYLGKGSSTDVGGAFCVVHNGTILEEPHTEQYRKVAGSGTAIFQLPHNFTNYVSSGNTNSRTIKVQGRCLYGGSEFLVNKGSNYTSHIEILEIAG